MTHPSTRRGLLVIVDGMGLRDAPEANAVTRATMPFLFGALSERGHALLEASGTAVGLEEGQAGNSEIGHLTIGAGARVVSTLERVQAATADGSWRAHPLWSEIAARGPLHLVGLVSDAGVHGHLTTLAAAAEEASARGVPEILVHAVLDGVDSAAGSAPRLMGALAQRLASVPRVRLGCVVGRRDGCDRSGDLATTRRFVATLTNSDLPRFSPDTLAAHVAVAHEADFPGHLWAGGRGIAPGESVLLSNHRADRTEQLARVLAESQPVYGLIELGAALAGVFFPVRPLARGLASELRDRGLRSLRIAERCKFPHVTWFLNGLERSYGEATIELPSVAETAIRAHPEMSLGAVTAATLEAVADARADVIVVNLANLDQVGHLGDLALARQAAVLIDDALRTLHDACAAADVAMVVTSDHGNADTMADAAGRPLGSHSACPVPLVLLGAGPHRLASAHGSLAQVAATLLATMGREPPEWMAPSLLAVRDASG